MEEQDAECALLSCVWLLMAFVLWFPHILNCTNVFLSISVICENFFTSPVVVFALPPRFKGCAVTYFLFFSLWECVPTPVRSVVMGLVKEKCSVKKKERIDLLLSAVVIRFSTTSHLPSDHS